MIAIPLALALAVGQIQAGAPQGPSSFPQSHSAPQVGPCVVWPSAAWPAITPGQGQGTPAGSVSPQVLVPDFKTGYEPGEASGTPAGEITWLVYQNTSTTPPSYPWSMSVYYETPGVSSDRYADIIPDPTGVPGNNVLHYWLKNAVIDAGYQSHTKGRIQTGFSVELDVKLELYGRQRMYIHPDMNLLHSYPSTGDSWWLAPILQEFWSNRAWLGEPNPSRINLSLYSFGGQMHLDMICKSSVDSRVFWQDSNPGYVLPVGEWLTIETGYRMGDATTGRMVVVVTRESTGEREVVFDITDWTYDPEALDPGGPGPIPVNAWNPQKLYASDNVIHHIRDNGGVAQVYWDDFEFSGAWPASWP